MNYPRKILNQIKKQIKSKEIIILTGMRRTGKTTLYRMLFEYIKSKNKIFLDMENPIEQKIFEEKDYNNILLNLAKEGIDSKKKSYIFLDEIQAAPQAIGAVKYLYDHYNIKFFLTGSSSFYLKNFFPESLAGRKFVFEIFPLDFEEFLVFKNKAKQFHKNFSQKDKNKNKISYEKLKKDYDEYIEFGGFPNVVLSKNKIDKKLRLNDIFKSYFEKDARILANFKEIKAFRDIILLLMQRVGSKLEISKLASEISVSRETVYSFLSFLEATYFVYFIKPFSRNVDREISGSRKVYLCDNGLLNNFAKISDGALFENSIFLNLRNYGKINYYQKRSGGEIDFIVKQTAIEVKIKGTEFDIKKLYKTAQSIGIKQYYLLTKDFNEKKKFIPAIEL
ncbi:MAG: ATP-binding protein [Patescibacteria group bacterium]